MNYSSHLYIAGASLLILSRALAAAAAAAAAGMWAADCAVNSIVCFIVSAINSRLL